MWSILGLALLSAIVLLFNNALVYRLVPLMLGMGIRFTVAGLSLLFYQFYFNRTKFKINPHLVKQYAMVCVFGFIIPQVVWGGITNYLPNVETSLVMGLEPLTICLMLIFIYHVKVSPRQLYVLIACTTVLLIVTFFESQIERAAIFSHLGGLTLLIIASCGYSWLIINELVNKGEPGIMITGVGALACGLTAFLIFVIFSKHQDYSWDIQTILILTVLIICGEILLHRMRANLSKKFSTVFLSTNNLFIPFALVASEVSLFSRPVDNWFFLLIIPVLFLVYAFYQEELRLSKNHKI